MHTLQLLKAVITDSNNKSYPRQRFNVVFYSFF